MQAKIHRLCRQEQRDLLDQLNNASGWRKEGDLGTGNEAVSAAHDERTILELIQNARDAIQSGRDKNSESSDRPGSVAVIVGPESLYIANTGSPFRLHDEQTFEAVTALNRSEKAYDRGSIGEKGVGMKSILQTAEQFSIHSVVDSEGVSAHFSRSRSASMLLETYADLLDDPDFRTILEEEYEPAVIDDCVSIVDDLSLPVVSPTPDELDVRELSRLQPGNSGRTPPNPVEVLRDLPRLSLFRYPFADDQSSNESGKTRDFTDVLLDTPTDDSYGSASIDDALKDRLSDLEGEFRTVLRLDYADERWAALLDELQEPLTEGSLSEHHPNAIRQFTDSRSDVDGEIADGAPQKIWNECAGLDRETLVLLGEIGDIEFLRVTRDEMTDQLVLDTSRRIEIRSDEDQSVGFGSDTVRRTVTVTENTNRSAERTERLFRLYSRPVEVDTEISDDSNSDAGTFDEPIRLLFEAPRPNDDRWAPKRYPLYLFYPIEEAKTPFPFVVHAPFQVGFDRQELDRSNVNAQLLKEIPDFVSEAAIDLISTEDGATLNDDFAAWMPWLVMPFQPRPDSSLDITPAVCDALCETAIVPSHDGDVLEPTQVLLDPDRLHAFEPLRAVVDSSPVVAEESVDRGAIWLERARDARTIQSEQNRDIASKIGLTTVIDRPFHQDEDAPGLVSTLRDVWGVDPQRSEANTERLSWGVTIESEEHAREYFESICAALNRYKDDDEIDCDRDPAQKLGEWYVPLLPAEVHEDGHAEAESEIGYLVRASRRDAGGNLDRYERSDRIVFRRSETSDSPQSSIDHLTAPPETLDVYITPFDEDWSGTLAANYREWGTRALQGPATYYQRIAAEVGGFSDPNDSGVDADEKTRGYLLDLYHTISNETSVKRTLWLYPTPHQNRQFSGGERQVGVEDLLSGNYFGSLPDDHDTFLERRYSQCIPLPTASGEAVAAEKLAFGPQWIDMFESVADALESGSVDDPFAAIGQEEASDRATDLRRWAAAIEYASEIDRQDTPMVAPPGDQWDAIVDEADIPNEERDLWLLNFLIHVGVQIGPHIEWGWFFPGGNGRDRRTGAIDLGDARQLSTGAGAKLEASPIDPTDDELEQYALICWRAENHPAFSASHTSNCRDNFLDCDPSEWIQLGGNDIVIPTWWRFTELDGLNAEATRSFRRAVLLAWPELSGNLFETAWFCTDTGHTMGSNKRSIPALGLVQLRTTSLWPTKWPNTGDWEHEEGHLGPYQSRLNPASRLVFDPSEGGRGRNVEGEIPAIDVEMLHEDIDQACDRFEIDAFDIDIRAVGFSLGAKPIDEHTPAEAAAQLDWFLRAQEAAVEGPSSGDLSDLPPDSSEAIRRAAFGLVRRFVTREHLREYVPNKEADLQRRWQRRDVWHTGTRLLVNQGGNFTSVAIGEGDLRSPSVSIDIYTERLPGYARGILEDRRSAFVELPADRSGDLARVLGDSADENPVLSFGIQTRDEGEIPELQPAQGASIGDSYRSELQTLADAIDDRISYLVAAYDRATNAQVDLESVYSELQTVTNNPIGVVERSNDGPGDRRSALWIPPDSEETCIAVFEDILNATDDGSIPEFYAADGLVQVIDDQPSQRTRNAFENVLMKELPHLEQEYKDDLMNIEARIAELNENRLRRVHSALDTLLDHLDGSRSLPEVKWTSIDAETVWKELLDADPGSDDWGGDSDLLATWMAKLSKTGGLDEQDVKRCVVAARESDTNHRQQLMAQVAKDASNFQLAKLAESDPWADLDEWGGLETLDVIETYVTAISTVEEFWAVVTETADPGEDVLVDAIEKARRRDVPGATASTSEVIPRLPEKRAELRDIPLITLPELEGGPVPAPLREAVLSWCQDERSRVLEMDVVFADEENRKLFDTLCEALETPAESAKTVRAGFREFTNDKQVSSCARQERVRKKRTKEWLSEESRFSTIDFSQTELSKPSEPELGGSSSVGNKTGRPSEYSNAEIPADRGRDAELICMERAWNRFVSLNEDVRSDIVRAVEDWRSYDDWRMKPAPAVLDDPDSPLLDDISDYSDAIDHLTATTIEEDESTARAVFRALVDTSDERGPGFDYIDPFGRQYDSVATDGWSREQMTRTEVKAVMPERATKGRFELTGNEFRMARRAGPSEAVGDDPTDGTVDRYLVRIILLPRNWERESGRGGIEIRDIDDVVKFGKFDEGRDPVWEKLRGGKFYVNFEFEK
ncbi:hypothetical protein RBH26_14715 [Natronolimnohabitans sp. A-GB9]|uniref:sacsin N-terminal ATP-binding-like domain-containing protein n=1 Tax=Natronolimnohabitans sp. A-GB9 TaxID=3069757 RepID=UPI0027AFE979|nr:hypothetical protein [Natronolimnohabitans sp. A-GB9]MDQ2051729.1 hypothetical protein [Natronolimnohabitans sp. A-GB9]